MQSENEHGGACHFGPLPPLPWSLGHVRLISFLGLVCAALLFFSTCWSSNSGPSGPVSNYHIGLISRFLAQGGGPCEGLEKRWWTPRLASVAYEGRFMGLAL